MSGEKDKQTGHGHKLESLHVCPINTPFVAK